MTTRRDLLRALGAAAVGSALPAAVRAQPSRRALEGMGVQLYTLRADMRRDPEGTLARIAGIGFDEIEWWGEFGRTPQQLRALLDQHGLRAPAWHVPVEALGPERLPRTIETAQVMGHRHLIVAWTAPDQRSAEGFQRLGNLLSEAGRLAAPAGIRTGYHNHDFEFAPVSDGTLFDLLVAGTDATYVDIELDCYWAFKAGHDPIALLRTLGDRITHLHLKDSAGPPGHRQMDVGAGVIDWRTLLREAVARRVRHAFVEHDEPADAWATASAGLRYLRSIGY
jgi:sugar phosphate isomerase/epimerase